MKKEYKWSLGFFVFSFWMGMAYGVTKGDFQSFCQAFSIVAGLISAVLAMVGFLIPSTGE